MSETGGGAPRRGRGKRLPARSGLSAPAIVAVALSVAAPAGAAGAPLYRCPPLEQSARDSAAPGGLSQGLDGWFFRGPRAGPRSDLAQAMRPGPEALALLGRLGALLAARGVRFVVVPLPPRGLVAAAALDGGVDDQAVFDAAVAGAGYGSLIAGLRSAGLAVAGLEPRDVAGLPDPGFYFRRAEGVTVDGGWLIATRVARLLSPGLLTGGAPPPEGTPHAAGGAMAQVLERLCTDLLPAETAAPRKALPPAPGAAPLAIAGAESDAGGAIDLAGLMTSATGHPARIEAGPDPVSALLGYLESPRFQQTPPAVLVWVVPAAWFADLGIADLWRLTAAAAGDCAGTARQAGHAALLPGGAGLALPSPAQGRYAAVLHLPAGDADGRITLLTQNGKAPQGLSALPLVASRQAGVPNPLYIAPDDLAPLTGAATARMVSFVWPEGRPAQPVAVTLCRLPDTAQAAP